MSLLETKSPSELEMYDLLIGFALAFSNPGFL